MDPRDPKRTTTPGQQAPDRDVVRFRRMDPRWWLLPPIVALCILGAYFLGQRMTPETAEPVEQQPVAQQPVLQQPAPPKGQITVTEVPRPAPAPVTPTPAPPVATTPPPAPPKPEPYHQVEPPVVLPPPAPTPDQDSGENTPSAPPTQPAAQPPADAAPSEPDREPRKLNEPALEYPSSAYEAGIEGTARVGFTVTADGKIEDVRVLDSSGDSRLDQAAADYVRRLRFRPGIRNGKPADVRVSRSVQFKLH